MIFIPSLSMLEYLDKFGKTVSVVEWIVYLNNSLLASETSLFQTICEMTDCSHLLKNKQHVRCNDAMGTLPSGLPGLTSLCHTSSDFNTAPLSTDWSGKMVHAGRGFLFVALQTTIFHLTGKYGWTMMWSILFQRSKWEVLYQPLFKAHF